MTDFQIDKTEEKTRKNWRLCMLIQALYPFALIGAISLALIFTASWQAFNNELIYSFFKALFELPFWYLLYYCAYKKHGNIYLTLCLIFSPLGIFRDFYEIPLMDELGAVISLFFKFLYYPLFVWWFWLSIKLRNINKKIHHQIICSSDAYTKAVPILQEAINVEDLNNKFAAIVRESPGITSVLNKIYKDKKKNLMMNVSRG